VRAPRILVTGVVDQATDQVIEGIEVFFIQFTLFEPGSFTCDPRFYDASTDTWYADFGSTYEVAFRLTADVDSGFNFITGSQAATADFGAGFQPGLTLASVTQVNDDNCAGGNCGATPGNTSAPVPCDNNSATGGAVPGTPTGFALSSTNAQIVGFTPVE
jgi:hypothetical protein